MCNVPSLLCHRRFLSSWISSRSNVQKYIFNIHQCTSVYITRVHLQICVCYIYTQMYMCVYYTCISAHMCILYMHIWRMYISYVYIWICTQFALSQPLPSSWIFSSSYVQIYIDNIHICRYVYIIYVYLHIFVYYTCISYICIYHTWISEYVPDWLCHRHFWVRGSFQAHMCRYTYIIHTYVDICMLNKHIVTYVYIINADLTYMYICIRTLYVYHICISAYAPNLLCLRMQIYLYDIHIVTYVYIINADLTYMYICIRTIYVYHVCISAYAPNLLCHRHYWVRYSCQTHPYDASQMFRYTYILYTYIHVYRIYVYLHICVYYIYIYVNVTYEYLIYEDLNMYPICFDIITIEFVDLVKLICLDIHI